MKSLNLNLLMFTAAMLCGCGGSSLPEGATGTVSGKLTSSGQAAPVGATVVMIHKDKGITASGTADAEGNYSLKMRGEGAVLTGAYFVGVTPPAAPEVSPEEYDKAMAAGVDLPGPDLSAFPPKYLNPQDSGVVFEVNEGDNTFDLDMKKE